MEGFVYLALSIVAFLQFIPPQLCREIKGLEIVHKDRDGLVDSRIDINFISKEPLEADVGNNEVASRQIPDEMDVIDVNITCVESLCENVPNYPLEKIQEALKEISSNEFPPLLQGDLIKTANRLSSPEDTLQFCDARQRTIFPQMARNTKDEEKYIVNIPGITQQVVVTTCGPNASGCGNKVSFPPGYISECTQRHSLVRLFSFDTENGREGFVPKYDYFPFPSCCECSIKET